MSENRDALAPTPLPVVGVIGAGTGLVELATSLITTGFQILVFAPQAPSEQMTPIGAEPLSIT